MTRIEPSLWGETLLFQSLNAHHDRAGFDCGEASLNAYLQRYARQNMTRDFGVTWVAVTQARPQTILGYYTLANSTITREDLPADTKLPPYAAPSCLLGRLAVSRDAQGQNIGKYLLIDAFARVVSTAQQNGIYALEVHALHDRVLAFYLRFGFTPLADDPLHLYLPVARLREFLAPP